MLNELSSYIPIDKIIGILVSLLILRLILYILGMFISKKFSRQTVPNLYKIKQKPDYSEFAKKYPMIMTAMKNGYIIESIDPLVMSRHDSERALHEAHH